MTKKMTGLREIGTPYAPHQKLRKAQVYNLFTTIPKNSFDHERFNLNEHTTFLEEKIAEVINDLPDFKQERISRVEVKGKNVFLSFRKNGDDKEWKNLGEKIFERGLSVPGVGMLRFCTEKNKTFCEAIFMSEAVLLRVCAYLSHTYGGEGRETFLSVKR